MNTRLSRLMRRPNRIYSLNKVHWWNVLKHGRKKINQLDVSHVSGLDHWKEKDKAGMLSSWCVSKVSAFITHKIKKKRKKIQESSNSSKQTWLKKLRLLRGSTLLWNTWNFIMKLEQPKISCSNSKKWKISCKGKQFVGNTINKNSLIAE